MVSSSESSNERVNRARHDALAVSDLGDDTRLSSPRVLLYFVKFLPTFISPNAERVDSDAGARHIIIINSYVHGFCNYADRFPHGFR